MRNILLLAACAALSACVFTTPPPVTPPPHQDSDSCGALQLQHLIGSPAPQPFPANGPVRIYRTGDALTMDFSADRMNVELDPQTSRIISISCG